MKKNKNVITGIALTILLLGSFGASASHGGTYETCRQKQTYNSHKWCANHHGITKKTIKKTNPNKKAKRGN